MKDSLFLAKTFESKNIFGEFQDGRSGEQNHILCFISKILLIFITQLDLLYKQKLNINYLKIFVKISNIKIIKH